MSVGVYSPEDFDIIIDEPNLNLNHVITGYAEGTGVTLTPYTNRQTEYFGVKGDPSVSRSAIKAYTLTVHLAQTSRTNDIFFLLQKRKREGYDPTFNITILDRASGITQIVDTNAFMTTEGEWTIASEIGTRDWTAILPTPEGSIGGNGRFSFADERSYTNMGGTVPEEFRPR